MTSYACSACKLAVIVVGGATIRACKCNAPVSASVSSVVVGTGGVKADK